MKTAIEWLEEEYIKRSNNMVKMSVLSAFSEAKEMFEKQIEDAFVAGWESKQKGEEPLEFQYYNETFKTDKA